MEAKSPIPPRFFNGDEFEDRVFHPTGGYRFVFLFLAIDRVKSFANVELPLNYRGTSFAMAPFKNHVLSFLFFAFLLLAITNH